MIRAIMYVDDVLGPFETVGEAMAAFEATTRWADIMGMTLGLGPKKTVLLLVQAGRFREYKLPFRRHDEAVPDATTREAVARAMAPPPAPLPTPPPPQQSAGRIRRPSGKRVADLAQQEDQQREKVTRLHNRYFSSKAVATRLQQEGVSLAQAAACYDQRPFFSTEPLGILYKEGEMYMHLGSPLSTDAFFLDLGIAIDRAERVRKAMWANMMVYRDVSAHPLAVRHALMSSRCLFVLFCGSYLVHTEAARMKVDSAIDNLLRAFYLGSWRSRVVAADVLRLESDVPSVAVTSLTSALLLFDGFKDSQEPAAVLFRATLIELDTPIMPPRNGPLVSLRDRIDFVAELTRKLCKEISEGTVLAPQDKTIVDFLAASASHSINQHLHLPNTTTLNHVLAIDRLVVTLAMRSPETVTISVSAIISLAKVWYPISEPAQSYKRLKLSRSRGYASQQGPCDSLSNRAVNHVSLCRLGAARRCLLTDHMPTPGPPDLCMMCNKIIPTGSLYPTSADFGESAAHHAMSCDAPDLIGVRLNSGLQLTIDNIEHPPLHGESPEESMRLAAFLGTLDEESKAQVLFNLMIGGTVEADTYHYQGVIYYVAEIVNEGLKRPSHTNTILGVVSEIALLRPHEEVWAWPPNFRTTAKPTRATIIRIDRSGENSATFDLLFHDGEFQVGVKASHILTPPSYRLPNWKEHSRFMALGKFLEAASLIRTRILNPGCDYDDLDDDARILLDSFPEYGPDDDTESSDLSGNLLPDPLSLQVASTLQPESDLASFLADALGVPLSPLDVPPSPLLQSQDILRGPLISTPPSSP